MGSIRPRPNAWRTTPDSASRPSRAMASTQPLHTKLSCCGCTCEISGEAAHRLCGPLAHQEGGRPRCCVGIHRVGDTYARPGKPPSWSRKVRARGLPAWVLDREDGPCFVSWTVTKQTDRVRTS